MYMTKFNAMLNFDNRFGINFSPEAKGLYSIGDYNNFQFIDEISGNKAYDILKPLVKR